MPLLYPGRDQARPAAARRARPGGRRARRDRGRRRGRAPPRDRARRGHRLRRRSSRWRAPRARRSARASCSASRGRCRTSCPRRARPLRLGGCGRRPVGPAALRARDELEAADCAGRWSWPSARRRCSPAQAAALGPTGMLLAAPDSLARVRALRGAARLARVRRRARRRRAGRHVDRGRARPGLRRLLRRAARGRRVARSRRPTTASWSSSARCCSWRGCRSPPAR